MKDTSAILLAALLLATVTFWVYAPSLRSDFVYDARTEILEEGFITSLSNLPAVLTLKVLGSNLMLGSRPGEMLYLMLNAAIWGKNPWGYHLVCNLLHATNVALLYGLLMRLVTAELPGLEREQLRHIRIGAAAVTLIFALHPLAVEPVAAINFSSDSLATCFTLTALLAATAFRPGAIIPAVIGTLCAFAAVTVKESGVAVAPILVVYWLLFRRSEKKAPWLVFLGSATAATLAFLAARFLLAASGGIHPGYIGGSISQVFLIQPRLWVFMMSKLLCPLQLSADYTLQNVGVSTAAACAILLLVLVLQLALAVKSRLGALGVAVFWLGLATVSNFVPLYCISADRYYYLPLVGFAMQLLALFVFTLRSSTAFWLAVVASFLATISLTLRTLDREKVFADDFALWSDTVNVSPFSPLAHNGLADALLRRGEVDAAIAEFRRALELAPVFDRASNNLAVALLRQGQLDAAIAQWRQAVKVNPNFAEAHSNLGNALLKKGEVDEAILEGRKALDIDPYSATAHYNLGLDFMQKGDVDAAVAQYQRALEIDPTNAQIHNNLGVALLQKRQADDALAQFQQAVALDPANAEADQNDGTLLLALGRSDDALAPLQKAAELNPGNADLAYNLGLLDLQKGQIDAAIARFRHVLQLDPKRAEAHNNLAVALYQKGDLNGTIAEFQAVVQLKPGDAKAQANLAKAQAMARASGASK